MPAFVPQRQSWVVVTEIIWPSKPKMFIIWLLIEKLADFCSELKMPALSIMPKCWWIQIACDFAKSSCILGELLNCHFIALKCFLLAYTWKALKIPGGARFLSFILAKIQSHSFSCSKWFDSLGHKRGQRANHAVGLGWAGVWVCCIWALLLHSGWLLDAALSNGDCTRGQAAALGWGPVFSSFAQLWLWGKLFKLPSFSFRKSNMRVTRVSIAQVTWSNKWENEKVFCLFCKWLIQ